MRKLVVLVFLSVFILLFSSYNKESLRDIYSRPSSRWPKPFIDKGVIWTELGVLPPGPLEKQKDSLKDIIELGKALFFDTRLSGSGKISCATCHQPELHWTDGKEKSVGHEGAITKRNSPTIANCWFYKQLFWDGRAKDLQDQAFGPINSETEMHSEMPEVMMKLRGVKGYRDLFKRAFGDEGIDPDRMTAAIATFEKTIVSNKSRFDLFLEGDRNALTDKELRGLHLFRTTARCMNCHNGPLFSDNQFHNNGFSLDSNQVVEKGRYEVTHKDEDLGKFKTPSLRDVMHTGPWMHNGKMKSIEAIIGNYKKGGTGTGGADSLILELPLSLKDQTDLLAFIKAISVPATPFSKPVLPQ